jgi:phosphohistidine phosphatase
MKTLYVLRHGQAAPAAEGKSDYERELTPRGQSGVRRAAKHLRKRPTVPSLILASSAARARQTAEACLAALPGVRLVLADELYLAEPSSYFTELAESAEPHAAVVVVGHNPGLEALIYVLTECSEHLATASLVEIELEVAAWSELSGRGRGGAGRITDVFRT